MSRNRLTLFRLVSVIVVLAGMCPLHAYAQFVYVNDNNFNSGANTATGYKVVPGPALSIIAGSPYATFGTGLGKFFAPLQEVAIAYGTNFKNCLFVSDPLVTSSFPNGDIAAYKINAGTGVLTYVGNFVDPTDTSGANNLGIPLAIDRRVGFPYLFAGFTGESKIAYFKVNPGNCKLTWVSSTPAVGISGSAPPQGMAVTKTGPHVVVVSYGDGSVQTFKIVGASLVPKPLVTSTGFINQSAIPEGVDITANGKYAVFGDNQPLGTEVEVAKILPSGALSTTVDYGGPANASGVNLGPGVNSQNVWISPGFISGKNYLYISNDYSSQVTTARLSGLGIVSAIPSTGCTGVFTNPTTLNPGTWSFPAGLHTVKTTPSGTGLVVGEFGGPSSVALLRIQNTSGCTKEVTGSPFADPNSNFGVFSLDVFPSRPF